MSRVSLSALSQVLDRLGSDCGAERAAAGLIASKMVADAGASWPALLSGPATLPEPLPNFDGASPTDVKPNRMAKYHAKAWLDRLDQLGGMTEAEQRFVWITWKRLTSRPGTLVTVGEQQQLYELYNRRATAERLRALKRGHPTQ